MRVPLYQIDAFASQRFAGNPAAVCPLEEWLPEDVMQAVAAENNLAETAFFAPSGEPESDYHLRWFTPAVEVDLCGHATLATAHVLWECLGIGTPEVRFSSRSGPLSVAREGDLYVLDFPAKPPHPVADPEPFAQALGATPERVLQNGMALAVFADEAEVAALTPNLAEVAALDCFGVIATAPGRSRDFVSRYFVPQAGVDEDPVTGSAHCVSVPYWAARLGRTHLEARQISARGGDLSCRLEGDRVKLGGRCALYLEGWIHL